MATVYLARDLRHQREVALKVLRPELSAVLGGERFLNEIRISAQLDHPHILTLIDSGADDSFLWYVLPYVRGESLRAKLERETQLALDEALQITRQIAGALDYAHQRGVIHRDIKPENILLHEGEAVLADFGIALAVTEAGGNRLTETGLSLGTPQYMSPEQATGGGTPVNPRSDIYSLGAVLFEMLAGEPPHTGRTAQAVIAKLLTERPMRIRTVREAVPEALDSAIAKALSKVPADRFASAGGFAEAVTSAATATPTTETARMPRNLRRRRIGAAVLGGVALAGVAGVYLAGRGPSREGSVAPQLLQLTTDGNTRVPALSPDGSRLALVARDCDARERCSERVVVQDTGGAGSITVMRGSAISSVRWMSQGRFLVAFGLGPSGFGAYVVPALGGTPRFLGCCAGVPIGLTDTLLLSPFFVAAADGVVWLKLLTVSDGITRDSVPVKSGALLNIGVPGHRNGRVAVLRFVTATTMSLLLLDRSGRVTDSTFVPGFPGPQPMLAWAPGDDALVYAPSAPGMFGPLQASGAAIIRFRITAAGRFAGPVDTLLQLPPGATLTDLHADGTAMLAQGPADAVVHALERASPGSLDFRTRRLAASTARLTAALSRDGRWVLLSRSASQGAGAARRDVIVPFEGGPERPFSLPPGQLFLVEWTRPVSSALLLAIRDPAGQARLHEVTVATGRIREIATVPEELSGFFSLPGGGYGYSGDLKSGSMNIVGRPGKRDTIWTVRVNPNRIGVPAAVAPDGKAFLSYTWNAAGGDTAWYEVVPLDGGAPREVLENSGGWIIPDGVPTMLSDGSIEYVIAEMGGAHGWYRIPPRGGRTVRLGEAPIPGANFWAISQDGHRALAVKIQDRPDAYLVRNFAELLRRR